ncbi:unnamed protein product [Candidula unifasciata]|uniref:Uncharacterized protein n=1 Tax=Candidula unifasciata TaxID=100452 RepID=A0A8S3YQY8_9EUPU|nr:unnamed protein product [Candidula unifasciata]
MADCKKMTTTTSSSSENKEKFLLAPPAPASDSALSLEWADSLNHKNRRRSTIHSYTVAVYHTLPKDAKAMKEIRAMTSSKAAKNLVSISVAFMLIYTGFVSLQSLQSSLYRHGGLGMVSLSVIYGTTVLSCLLAPWLINRLTTKWTMVLAFSIFTAYFAANFYPRHFLLLPLSVLLGALAGPMWSAQATYVTTLALTYAQHKRVVFESDDIINQFMGVFFGFYRCSQIWGNLISTLILTKNETEFVQNSTHDSLLDLDVTGKGITNFSQVLSFIAFASINKNVEENSLSSMADDEKSQCGAKTCSCADAASRPADGTYSNDLNDLAASISDSTRYMLLTTYLACGVMAAVVIVALLDQVPVGKTEADPEFSQSSWELCLATIRMLKDTKCLLLMPLVIFVGLEQGFMFGDFTKAYVNCAMGMHRIGPILICFGTVSAISSITIGCFSKHIKRFAFIAAGATFNVGLLIVLWLWRPYEHDVPNFYVVASCLGLCDAIWQTQTYTLFGVLFSHKQEAAFASYRMFHAGGCAMAFGYSYFLCVQTKVFILAGSLAVSLALYSVIEMKMQLQSQHIGDIVAL